MMRTKSDLIILKITQLMIEPLKTDDQLEGMNEGKWK
jgi:hypothetical protein